MIDDDDCPTVAEVLSGTSPDGEYEDEYFIYTVKDGQVTMTGKRIKSPFIYPPEQLL